MIKGTEESTLDKDSASVSLMRHDPSVLGSLILICIIPNERTLSFMYIILNESGFFL